MALDKWIWGNQGRGPGWWAVALWVGLVGLLDVGLTASIWQANQASGGFLVAVSLVAWLWVLASLRQRPPRPEADDGGR